MSDFLLLETDTEQLREIKIVFENGLTAGKAILTFLSTLSCYLDSKTSIENDAMEWFSSIEILISNIGCLTNSRYHGDWNYSCDEYERFLTETSLISITKERFISSVRQVEEKWKDIREIDETVTKLISLLQSNPEKYKNTWFFDHHYTLGEFIALSGCLQMGIKQGAKKVRLSFY
jgi:hypothetical protein